MSPCTPALPASPPRPAPSPAGACVGELAALLGARILTHEERSARVRIDRVAAGNRVSDLLAGAGAATLIVSELRGAPLARIAELLDVPSICVVGAEPPGEPLVRAARDSGTILLLAPADLATACRRLAAVGLPVAREAA